MGRTQAGRESDRLRLIGAHKHVAAIRGADLTLLATKGEQWREVIGSAVAHRAEAAEMPGLRTSGVPGCAMEPVHRQLAARKTHGNQASDPFKRG
ncbi:hypothetical protein Vqi01_59510 [Micromonospora qiuiae]|uniref:Uncharacterized protein n=1 Tax=Micromonospora qiuiae TaxID=502268 RepID=A0ABQ4JME4_9ACTN|nr:hypothetical protein Vqi01_59510 [Micromonospora qiuiae]